MKKHILPPFLTSIFLTVSLAGAQEQNPTLTIDAGAPAAKVNPLHYGLMTEEINHSYDGGLYAELIRNRAFLDDARTPAHWTAVQSGGSNAKIALDSSQSLNSALTTSLRLDVSVASAKEPAGFANDGYWGIPVKPNTSYHSSFYAKAAPGFSGPVTLTIESTDGKTIYASASVSSLTADWKQYTATLKTGRVALTSNTRFAVKVQHSGTAWFSLVSLFPPTYKNRPNGLRPDLMQMLVDLKPAFLRFPGGNYVEGGTIATRFDWKKTIGPVVERPGHPCPWGYRSTDGMGLLEFLLWCEDMGAEPVLAVYAGYSLGGERALPGAALDPFVKEALEEIEYVSGSVKTKWGAQRAKDGHPRPFKLQYVEVGNEDFFDRSGSYDARFAQLYDAIKKSYPSLKVASTVGNEQPGRQGVLWLEVVHQARDRLALLNVVHAVREFRVRLEIAKADLCVSGNDALFVVLPVRADRNGRTEVIAQLRTLRSGKAEPHPNPRRDAKSDRRPRCPRRRSSHCGPPRESCPASVHCRNGGAEAGGRRCMVACS